MCFTSDGKFMALAERHSCKDFIGIYYCGDWSLVNVSKKQKYQLNTN